MTTVPQSAKRTILQTRLIHRQVETVITAVSLLVFLLVRECSLNSLNRAFPFELHVWLQSECLDDMIRSPRVLIRDSIMTRAHMLTC